MYCNVLCCVVLCCVVLYCIIFTSLRERAHPVREAAALLCSLCVCTIYIYILYYYYALHCIIPRFCIILYYHDRHYAYIYIYIHFSPTKGSGRASGRDALADPSGTIFFFHSKPRPGSGQPGRASSASCPAVIVFYVLFQTPPRVWPTREGIFGLFFKMFPTNVSKHIKKIRT